jgi:hypothetical protein
MDVSKIETKAAQSAYEDASNHYCLFIFLVIVEQ